MNSISSEQLQEELKCVQKKLPQLCNTLLQVADDVLRIYITLHYTYHHLSQNVSDFTHKSQRLLAALHWIEYSAHDPYELSCAIEDAKKLQIILS